MKFSLAVLAAACAFSLPAQADDSFYAGIGATRAGSVQFAPGIASDNRRISLAAYGGYNISDALALEVGYGDPGSFRSPAAGPAYTLSARHLYVAAKGTRKLSDRWSLSAKLGVVRNEYDLTAPSGPAEFSSNRIMYGFGVAYQLTEKIALTLDFDNFGRTEGTNVRLRHRRLQAGLRFAF